jgi:hypothetical protein
MTTAAAPMPDLAAINPAMLWLAYLRQLSDGGMAIAAARQLADERSGTGVSKQTGAVSSGRLTAASRSGRLTTGNKARSQGGSS